MLVNVDESNVCNAFKNEVLKANSEVHRKEKSKTKGFMEIWGGGINMSKQ